VDASWKRVVHVLVVGKVVAIDVAPVLDTGERALA